MVLNGEIMYAVGILLAGIGAVIAFILGFDVMEDRQDEEWQELIENKTGRQTESDNE